MRSALQLFLSSTNVVSRSQSGWLSSQSRNGCFGLIMATKRSIRAKLLMDGCSSSGEGAHEAEVSYMRELGFSEKDTRFMNDLRYFRNSIKYYGRQFDQEYAEKVFNFMEQLYPQLKKAIE